MEVVMKETRAQERINCDIILNKIEDGHTNICRATNISLSGMQFMRMLEAQESDELCPLRLQFELPGQEEPIWVGAERVYDAEGCVGVRFVNISHHHFVLLREWLRERSISDVPEFRRN
jgi:hypothetical protein